ncbi:MAG TPA: hypothetical protein VGI40_08010 [Pirellulaceae bacterium]|jgi:hypothetical protein
MSTDFHQIQLSDEQKLWVAELAEQMGKPWAEVLDERLAPEPISTENGEASTRGHLSLEERQAWLERFNDWMGRFRSYNPHVDDSREGIYSDRS